MENIKNDIILNSYQEPISAYFYDKKEELIFSVLHKYRDYARRCFSVCNKSYLYEKETKKVYEASNFIDTQKKLT